MIKKYNKYHKNDTSGIYQIRCIANNKSYIGQSYHILNRRSKHFGMLKKNNHPNSHLQNAYNKYGIENFEWSVYKTCSIDQLNIEEECAIAAIGRENLFNFTDGGDGVSGYRHTEEYKKYDSKVKLDGWASGKYTTPEMAIKRINVFTGQEHAYDRVGNAEKDGFSKKSITSCICGLKKTHKGFFWLRIDDATTYEQLKNNLGHLSLQQAKSYYTFAMLLDDNQIVDEEGLEFVPKRRGGSPKKYIERIDAFTGMVKEYDSVASAARDGFDRSTVQKALRGKIEAYRGFYWKEL